MSHDILDEQGNPIPKWDSMLTRTLRWLGTNWRFWVPIGISLVALLVSSWSALQSTRNSAVTYRLSKLDFRPILVLNTHFAVHGNIPPHWTLTNAGPVDAVQVEVAMISHRYRPPIEKLMQVLDTPDTTALAKIRRRRQRDMRFQSYGWTSIPEQRIPHSITSWRFSSRTGVPRI